MGDHSKIEWTDHTFNPWWGCERVSPGCQHCYAEAFSKRTGHAVWGRSAERRFFGESHWRGPLKWDRWAVADGRRARVFCASMADVFEDRADVADERRRLFALIEETPNLDWLLLTKRPANVLRMVPAAWAEGGWPANVWIGTTVEDQTRADERVPELLKIPAAVRFLSCEPLLGPVELDPAWLDGIGWVIAGGESGNGARPMHPEWVRRLRDQCTEVGHEACGGSEIGPTGDPSSFCYCSDRGPAFLFKQWGEWAPWVDGTAGCDSWLDLDGKVHEWAGGPLSTVPAGWSPLSRVGRRRAGRVLDGREWDEVPVSPAAVAL